MDSVSKINRYRIAVFTLTFIAYCAFHLSRKPNSIVKSVLHPQANDGSSKYQDHLNEGWLPFSGDVNPYEVSKRGLEMNGAADSLVNGKYHCTTSIESNKQLCSEYANDADFILRLSKTDSRTHEFSVCASIRVMHPSVVEHVNEDENRCWIVVDAKNVLVYIQAYGGMIPAIVVKDFGKRTLYWYSIDSADISFIEEKDMNAVPDVTNGKILLGVIDTVFLTFYTIGLFCSGWIGDQVSDLRIFLAIGMWGSGFSIILLGFAYWFHIHSFAYFCFMNAIAGLFQSIGWPTVVAIMANWYGKRKRGFIFGLWNAHQSLGNALGSIVTASSIGVGMHKEDWPLGFIIPGIIIIVAGFLVFLFLTPHPRDAQITTEELAQADNLSNLRSTASSSSSSDDDPLNEQTYQTQNVSPLLNTQEREEYEARLAQSLSARISQAFHPLQRIFRQFGRALMIPGVIPFSLSLAFAKLVGYAIIFWAPSYLGHLGLNPESAGYWSSFFDLGGVFGGIAAGWLSDRLNARAIVAFLFLICSAGTLNIYYQGSTHLAQHGDIVGVDRFYHALLMIMCGFFINGPYSLIITAVSADLGQHKSLKGDESLLATVSGIIDGTGSLGAVVQGVLIGSLSTNGWKEVWTCLTICSCLSALCLIQLVYRELRALKLIRK